MKLYISGPMTGYPEWNHPAFNEAERQLRAVGYDVINPARHGSGRRWEYYMRLALKDVADAEGVALLPGYTHSRGATLEIHNAQALGMKTKYVETWIMDAP